MSIYRPDPTKPANFERLREAYAIIDGIPDKAFDLDDVITKSDGDLQCGTIACAAGWLMIHPKFAAELETELKVDSDPWYSQMRSAKHADFYDAMQHLFNMNLAEVRSIFSSRTPSELGVPHAKRLSHKKLWQARVRKFLVNNGQRLENSAR
ncbi:hypothetical protein D9M69_493940 [compost metagenome]